LLGLCKWAKHTRRFYDERRTRIKSSTT
jgi:hypothetical protein